ncbi:TIGR03862 family flavoprotein [Marinomonas epiphytica]
MQKKVIVVGAGPAGLMAAERIAEQGHQVHVYDAKPSACRKFLLAGVGGMNITHSEGFEDFIRRYYDKAQWLTPMLQGFDNQAVCSWIHSLGVQTFVGSSGRIFPTDMKAAPLLRSWLKRLREMGVVFHMRHKMHRVNTGEVQFIHNEEQVSAYADAIVLALGGASWPKLGADGSWQQELLQSGVAVSPLKSANCGFYSHWSDFLKERFAGAPLKGIAFRLTEQNGSVISKKGECILTQDGLEGSLVYAFSKYLREQIEQAGQAELTIDLLPQWDLDTIHTKLAKRKSKESFSKYLKRTVNISGVKAALLREVCDTDDLANPETLAKQLKSLPVTFYRAKEIDEVISSAGGVCEDSFDENLMLKAMPGVFCAGEMLDWEAPTGGYLLTACFATGRYAAHGVEDYLS